VDTLGGAGAAAAAVPGPAGTALLQAARDHRGASPAAQDYVLDIFAGIPAG
jgi:hypothetical protein